MITVRIADNEGHHARVTPGGELIFSQSPNPPIGDEILTAPWFSFLSINGVGDGDLAIDGSASPVDAFVSGYGHADIYVTTLNVLISDQAIALNRFGGIAGGLANGLEIFYESPLGRIPLSFSIKTNYDFIRIGALTAAVGSKLDAFQVNNAGAESEDAYNPVIDMSRFSHHGAGIRLRSGTRDRIGVRIADDISGLTVFNIAALGYSRVAKSQDQD